MIGPPTRPPPRRESFGHSKLTPGDRLRYLFLTRARAVGRWGIATADSFARDPNSLQRLVGLVAGISSLAIASNNAIKMLTLYQRASSFSNVLLNLSVTAVAFIGALGIVSAFWENLLAKWFQVFAFFATAALSALSSNRGDLTSAIFLIYGILLIAEYQLAPTGRYVAFVYAILFYPFFVFVGLRRSSPAYVNNTVQDLVAVAILVALYGSLVYRHFWRHRQEAALLESSVRERTTELQAALSEQERTTAELRSVLAEREAALAERSMVLRELNHRVKNNLNLVLSLLRLEAARHEGDVAKRVLEKNIRRIRIMYLLHDALFLSGRVQRVDLREYVERLLSWATRIVGSSVLLELRVAENLWVNPEFALPFGLLLNELVANSVEHAFPDGRARVLKVSIERSSRGRSRGSDQKARDVRLEVADNGVGLPAGVTLESAQGLGLTMVRALVDQLEGTIELDPTHGTRWVLELATEERPGRAPGIERGRG